MSVHTTKSFKSTARDKPKNVRGARKGGSGGGGAMGLAVDMRYTEDAPYLDENDPNYDPTEYANFVLYPVGPDVQRFGTRIVDLARYKKEVRDATLEYLLNGELAAFQSTLQGLNQSIYHQDVAKIVIRVGLDHSAEDQAKISNLLAGLARDGQITPQQFLESFRKLYSTIDDLIIDYPDVKARLRGFALHAVDNSFLDAKEAETLHLATEFLSDQKQVTSAKTQIQELVDEYFVSGDVAGAVSAVKALSLSFLDYEVAKRMVTTAMGRGDAERELTSKFLVASNMKDDQAGKAFSILLERVEDLYLDVPNVLELLTWFIARAITDEVLPPSFVQRVDLAEHDMGFQVIEYVRGVLQQPGASKEMSKVWKRNLKKHYEA